MSEFEVAEYHPPATWKSDFQVLLSMIFADIKGTTQQERLESFYKSQAHLYDSYRHRMLHGRFPMVKAMPKVSNGTWVDMGGGTGANLEFFKNLGLWGKVVVLDYCPSLVEVAKQRVITRDWTKVVDVVLGDACDTTCSGLPPTGTVDVVSFSYALSMIPDWKGAISNANRLLKPGGHIAVCDFTVTDSQWWGMAWFWTWVFAHDHVHLRREHVQVLKEVFEEVELKIGYGQFPYVPFLWCPYYYFVGKKAAAPEAEKVPPRVSRDKSKSELS